MPLQWVEYLCFPLSWALNLNTDWGISFSEDRKIFRLVAINRICFLAIIWAICKWKSVILFTFTNKEISVYSTVKFSIKSVILGNCFWSLLYTCLLLVQQLFAQFSLSLKFAFFTPFTFNCLLFDWSFNWSLTSFSALQLLVFFTGI